MTASALTDALDSSALCASIREWAAGLGFTGVGIATIDLPADEAHFLEWLRLGFHGEMTYMSRHGSKRTRPAELIPGTVSCISVRMDYWPQDAADATTALADATVGYVSRYALGRDYHKVLRARLQSLCERIQDAVGPFGHRVFTDSAPVLEKPLARNAGLGWIGKHTNLIDAKAGSYFFLGEIYLDLKLPADEPSTAHCGTCSACMPACPTGAIVAPYRLDARRCISYLTIELAGAIPEEFRRAIGNRIYGCDDCQLVCPWNKFARPSCGEGLRGPAWFGSCAAHRPVRVERGRFFGEDQWQCHPAHRLRTMAAQCRRGAGQCAEFIGGDSGASVSRGTSLSAGA